MGSFNFSKTIRSLLAGCGLMMLGSGIALAGGPNPGTFDGEQMSGPALVGTITLDGITASFSGNCKGKPVSVSVPFAVDLAAVQQEFIEGYRLPASELVGDCGTASGDEFDIIVNTVIKFSKETWAVNANVVAMFVVPANH